LDFALLCDVGGGTSKLLEKGCHVIWVCAVRNVHGRNGRATGKTQMGATSSGDEEEYMSESVEVT